MDIGTLIRDIGFPAAVALLLLYMMRELIKERKDMIDAETARAKLAREGQKADDDDRRQLIAMLGQSIASTNAHTAAINNFADVSNRRIAAVDKLIEQNQTIVEKLDATVAGHVADRAQMTKDIKGNTEAINGVTRALEDVQRELTGVKSALEDTQSKDAIQVILNTVQEIQKRYVEKQKKDTDELKPVTTPDTPPTAAEGDA